MAIIYLEELPQTQDVIIVLKECYLRAVSINVKLGEEYRDSPNAFLSGIECDAYIATIQFANSAIALTEDALINKLYCTKIYAQYQLANYLNAIVQVSYDLVSAKENELKSKQAIKLSLKNIVFCINTINIGQLIKHQAEFLSLTHKSIKLLSIIIHRKDIEQVLNISGATIRKIEIELALLSDLLKRIYLLKVNMFGRIIREIAGYFQLEIKESSYKKSINQITKTNVMRITRSPIISQQSITLSNNVIKMTKDKLGDPIYSELKFRKS